MDLDAYFAENPMGGSFPTNPGFIFQDSNLLDTLTGFENISLALTIKGEPARAIPGKVNAMAARLGDQRHGHLGLQQLQLQLR
ncbi:hypothetical protein NE591_15710, partial [Adlercreutzia sp. DFI.6.23]|nr:hypothetical protein [Adlercreutzia sp. DFI.6.23]